MPFLKITTSATIDSEQQSRFLKICSGLVSDHLNKSEQYVMVGMEPGSLLMSGDEAPAAMVELRSLGGLSPEKNKELSAAICDALETYLEIPAQRVFITFSEIDRSNWGWNSDTFS